MIRVLHVGLGPIGAAVSSEWLSVVAGQVCGIIQNGVGYERT